MIPILYESNETEFTSNGLGRLRDATSVVVTEERNGVYECSFEYPVGGQNYDLIRLGRIIAVKHDDTDDIQPFDIVSYSRPINGIVQFNAVHISYRQSKMVASGNGVSDLVSAFAMLRSAVPSNPFSYDTDITSTIYLPTADGVPRSVRAILGGEEGSILDTYGGEYEWDKFNVKLWQARGRVLDLTIRYGVNMTDFEDNADISDSYSSIVPYWVGSDATIKGNIVNSGAPTSTGRDEAVAVDFSGKFENRPTAAQLQTAASSMLAAEQPYLPAQSITVSFTGADGEQDEISDLRKCQLCDTVTVEFPRYDMSGQFKIVRTVYDVLSERFEEMELGALSVSLSEALGIENGFGSSNSKDSGIVDTYGAIIGGTWSSKSIGTGATWTELANFTIPEDGVWLLIAQLIYAPNATGHRTMTIATSSATAGVGIYSDRRQAVNGTETPLRVVAVVQGNTKYYVNTYHGASSAISCQGRYTAFKIGNSVNRIGG